MRMSDRVHIHDRDNQAVGRHRQRDAVFGDRWAEQLRQPRVTCAAVQRGNRRVLQSRERSTVREREAAGGLGAGGQGVTGYMSVAIRAHLDQFFEHRAPKLQIHRQRGERAERAADHQ